MHGRLPPRVLDRPAVPKVLIVEDEPDIRKLIRTAFELAGHRVTEASTGEEGLMMAAGGRPDLIILDVMLPGMSGGQVLERLQRAADTSRIPVIVVTASGQAFDTLMWQVGPDNTFAKPFDTDDLVARAAEILGNASN